MGRLWQCGFELNSTTTDVELSNVTGVGTTLQTTTVRTGTYALRTNPTAATSFVRYHLFAANQSTAAYQRVYVRFAAFPTGNTTIMRFVDAANNSCAQVRLTNSGTLVLLDAASNPTGSASSALSLDTWYRLELGVDASSSPGTVEARIDGTSFASGPNSAQTPWARVLIGPVVSATMDAYWDDWAVNDGSGSTQNSWPGAGKIVHLVPSGDGDAHGWSNTANGAGSSTNWTLVDDVPPNDTTDLVQTGTLNTEDMYALTDSGIGAGDTVNAVAVGLRLRNNTADATTAVKAQIKKASGGTVAQGSAIVPNSTTFATNAPAQPRNYTLIAYTDPDGSAWTQSTLDTAQAGIKLTTAGANRVQVTSVWVSVDYTPASGTSVSVADTAAAADAVTAAAAVAVTDAATGVDALTPVAAATITDTAAATDTVTAQAAVTATDTGGAADTVTATAGVPLADTAAGADAATVSAAISPADTAVAVDALTVARSVVLADSAAAVDAVSVDAATVLADQAAAADTATVAVPVALADEGTGVDVVAAAVQAALADSGSAADVFAQGSPVALDDTAAAVDGITVAAGAALQDAATAAEAITAAATMALAEAATAVDALTVDATLTFVDAAAAADTMAVPPPLIPGVLAVTGGPSATHKVSVTGAITATGAPASTMEVTAI